MDNVKKMATKRLKSINKEAIKECHEYHSQIDNYLNDNNYGFYNEDYFTEMLCLERKRTERSKKPFSLMLLNIENILQLNTSHQVLKDIASTLFSHTRELDIKGWYKSNAIIGIIFTEILETDIDSAMESIAHKIYDTLLNILGPGLLNKIDISLRFFPDNDNTESLDRRPLLSFYPEIMKSDTYHESKSLYLKQFFDIVGSVFGLILFSPFFLIIPLLIKLTSKGPILFKQKRVGQFGRTFTFLKFRSMYINNDDSIHRTYTEQLIKRTIDEKKSNTGRDIIFKLKDDPRITPIGRVLRKSSLDELPQFINVLRGEMSLVGPRPPIPYEFSNYDIWHRYRLMKMKPGITGLWQVTARSSTTFDEMVRLDLEYARKWSLWLDIKILALTPRVVLTGKGAY
jgi:lipopolysaccharide/colanic/teichoic acid biosynthesis glycosyltransferase/GGDEF domain-containing protein